MLRSRGDRRAAHSYGIRNRSRLETNCEHRLHNSADPVRWYEVRLGGSRGKQVLMDEDVNVLAIYPLL